MRCLMTRWAISRAADEGGELPDRARRHVDGCGDCEAFERRTATIGRSLASARGRAPEPAAPRQIPRHLTAAGLVTAGAIAVVLMVGGSDSPKPPPASEPVVANSDGDRPDEAIEPSLDVESLATDAEQGIRYMLRVSGLPEPR
jgi:hypothetical protein